MGVYIFQSLHAPYIKIGHYQGRNAYSRIAHRGFSSCVCPKELEGRVSMDDMELVAWFPRQGKKTEQTIKRRWKLHRVYGKSEWMPSDQLTSVLAYLENLEPNQAHLCDPFAAILSWKRL